MGGDQPFANGWVFWNPASDAYYVLRNDTMRWQYYQAHTRYVKSKVDPNIRGTVVLQGRTDHRGVVLFSPDGPHLVTDADGAFVLSYEGYTTLRIYHPGYLDVLATIDVALHDPLDMDEIVLLAGDVNGDNSIDIYDIAYVAARLSSGDAQADVNGDGTVDILDVTLVAINYNQTGPIPWP
jgi:hypothetical protein